MANIDKLTSLLGWRLQKGSHEWPGPDGGTCINEAAIVAAGFAYRAVRSADDCPPCFSPVIAEHLKNINDMFPDDLRQKLLPYVLRLSGSADSQAVEQQRASHLALETVRTVFPLALDVAGLAEHAKACRSATTLEAAKIAAWRVTKVVDAEWWTPSLTRAAVHASATVSWAAHGGTKEAVTSAANLVCAVAELASDDLIATAVLMIVDGVLAIGNQANPIDVAIVSDRMAKVKAEAIRS